MNETKPLTKTEIVMALLDQAERNVKANKLASFDDDLSALRWIVENMD